MDARSLTVIAPRGVAKTFDAGAMIGAWQDDLQGRVDAGEMAQATMATYRRGMDAFLAWAQDQALDRIGPQAIRAWKAAMAQAGITPAGVNVRFAGVRSFFRWAVASQGLAYDPTSGVQGARSRGKRAHKRDALTDGEVLRALAQPDPATDQGRRDRAILTIMAYTGLRTVEIQRATLGDLRTNGHVKLFVTGKGHVEADEFVALVHPDVLDALYSWLAVHPRGGKLDAPLFCGLGNRNQGQPLTTRAIRGIVKGAYKAAGIVDPRKTTHSLRHSLVTNLIRHGVAPVKIMTVTRHRSLDTLVHYAHEVARDDDPAEGYVDFGNGQGPKGPPQTR